MTARQLLVRVGLPVALVGLLAILVYPMASAQDVPDWANQDGNWEQTKASLQAFGERFPTSEAMFEAFKQAAGGGAAAPSWQQMGEPAFDWSGIYTRTKGGLHYDADLAPESGPVTAQLTPAGALVVQKKAEQLARTGGEYDPLSDCRPPGTPRWFTEPFLHEYIVTPGQTWLINEMVNDVRRVYTDGRAHTPTEDAYPTWNGDTIGFWNGDVLVAHTKDLMSGQYQRGVQPNYSDQTTVVERWHKVDAKTLQADVWVFDPVNLAKPWYTRQSWTQLTNDDKQLRIRYWDCRENPNNSIITTENGSSQFPDFDFVPDDAAVSSDADVKKAQEAKGAAK
ncbi:MAG: hypothetical protein ABL986_18135 [Vicinamibacterales bacterium]